MNEVEIGTRFRMRDNLAEPFPELTGEGGYVIARFLPSLSYRATGLNLELARKMVADGRAEVIDAGGQQPAGMAFVSAPGKTQGKVTITKGKRK